MLTTIAAIVRDGKIELLEPATLRDGPAFSSRCSRMKRRTSSSGLGRATIRSSDLGACGG